MVFGLGGTNRNNHQITGSASNAVRTQGNRKEKELMIANSSHSLYQESSVHLA